MYSYMKSFTDREITRLSSWLDSRQDFVFLDTSRVTDEDRCSFLFHEPVEWLICDNRDQVASFFHQSRDLQQQGYFLAGWFSYEFGYLLEPSLSALCEGFAGPYAVLGVFGTPVVFDHSRDTSRTIENLTGDRLFPETEYGVDGLRTNISKAEHHQAVSRIKEYLTAGDTYQVNFTMKLQFGFHGSRSSFYRALRRSQSVSFGAWIRKDGKDIMSFSPELFFRADDERITVRPMKGTMGRGRMVSDDYPRRTALREDVKNLSENVMIVDLLRNDLGHFLHDSGGGSVRPRSLFDVEVYETLLQMTSTIDGYRAVRQEPDIGGIMAALFPCGSVTGAPKIRTMQIIRELEREPRGIYCGAIGFCGAGRAVFNVPIRTVVLEERQGEMGVGSGIVFDSDPEAEWDECLLKGEFLTSPHPAFQLIETLLWEPGSGYWLFRQHMQRLADSAAYFFFRFERRQLAGLLEKEVRGCAVPMRVRLLLHRDGRVEISASPRDASPWFPPDPGRGGTSLPTVAFSGKHTDPDNIHLYHKTTARELYEEERRKALAAGCCEVLFTNKNGEVTEGSVSNIFIRRQGLLVTPPVSSGLLPGTFRRFLLEKGEAVEQVLCREDVLAADAVYIGNSVRGLIQVGVAP